MQFGAAPLLWSAGHRQGCLVPRWGWGPLSCPSGATTLLHRATFTLPGRSAEALIVTLVERDAQVLRVQWSLFIIQVPFQHLRRHYPINNCSLFQLSVHSLKGAFLVLNSFTLYGNPEKSRLRGGDCGGRLTRVRWPSESDERRWPRPWEVLGQRLVLKSGVPWSHSQPFCAFLGIAGNTQILPNLFSSSVKLLYCENGKTMCQFISSPVGFQRNVGPWLAHSCMWSTGAQRHSVMMAVFTGALWSP